MPFFLPNMLLFLLTVRMKTENGYVYFMYNPFTGLPDSDSDDGFDDDDYNRSNENGFNNLLFNYPPRKCKLKLKNLATFTHST